MNKVFIMELNNKHARSASKNVSRLEKSTRETNYCPLSIYDPSLAINIYENYLDLGYETLEILKKIGLQKSHLFLHLGNTKLLSICYISHYLDKGNYFLVSENQNIAETAIDYLGETSLNENVSYIKTSLDKFSESDMFNDHHFDYIFIQENIAYTPVDEWQKILQKLLVILGREGIILCYYLENFSIEEGELGLRPMKNFKHFLAQANLMGLNVKTLAYRNPISLRLLHVTSSSSRKNIPRRKSLF